jgi:hypothetical protein
VAGVSRREWRWLVRVRAQGTMATWTDSHWERRRPGWSWGQGVSDGVGQRRPGLDLAQGVAVAWCLGRFGRGNGGAWTGSRVETLERRHLGQGTGVGTSGGMTDAWLMLGSPRKKRKEGSESVSPDFREGGGGCFGFGTLGRVR